MSISFGISEESISLLGFGLDSLVEVFSATAVFYRFASDVGLRSKGTPSATEDAPPSRANGLRPRPTSHDSA